MAFFDFPGGGRTRFGDFSVAPGDVKLTAGQIRTELLSGLTVALALVPEAVAFAFVAGVHPLVGLYAAFLVGLITALIGGRPGMISGATGALAVVMVASRKIEARDYLLVCLQHRRTERNQLCELAFLCRRQFCGISMLVKKRCFVCNAPTTI